MEIEVGPFTLSGAPGGAVTLHAVAVGSYDVASLYVDPSEVRQLAEALLAFASPATSSATPLECPCAAGDCRHCGACSAEPHEACRCG